MRASYLLAPSGTLEGITNNYYCGIIANHWKSLSQMAASVQVPSVAKRADGTGLRR